MKAAQGDRLADAAAHIRNAPTKLMKDLGYGKGYAYDHDAAEAFSGQNYFPDGMLNRDGEGFAERGHWMVAELRTGPLGFSVSFASEDVVVAVGSGQGGPGGGGDSFFQLDVMTRGAP